MNEYNRKPKDLETPDYSAIKRSPFWQSGNWE